MQKESLKGGEAGMNTAQVRGGGVRHGVQGLNSNNQVEEKRSNLYFRSSNRGVFYLKLKSTNESLLVLGFNRLSFLLLVNRYQPVDWCRPILLNWLKITLM